jgi:predicted HicB family RNase H-like nuclease
MTMIHSIKRARLNLRFDETLRRQLEAAAKRTERSLNREVIYRLKQTFEREPIETTS